MKLFLAIVLTTLLYSHQAIADSSLTEVGQWRFALSVGSGKVTTPLSNRDDLHGAVLPAISYYGEHFYVENSFVGYSLMENVHGYIDLVGSLNDDGLFFELDGINQFGWWDALGQHPSNGKPPHEESFQDIERALSYMGGLSFNWLHDLVDSRLTLLQDISGVHHGREIHLTLRKNYSHQQWTLQWQVGAIYKNQRLNNYYYNVRPYELNNTPSWFSLPSSRQYFFGLNLSYQLTPDFAIQAFWQKNQLDEALLRSPLVRTDYYYSRFVGVRYSF